MQANLYLSFCVGPDTLGTYRHMRKERIPKEAMISHVMKPKGTGRNDIATTPGPKRKTGEIIQINNSAIGHSTP